MQFMNLRVKGREAEARIRNRRLNAAPSQNAITRHTRMRLVDLHKYLTDSGHIIPTILVTAYADNDVESRAMKDGVLCYLRKPVDEKHLERCLFAALQSRDRPGD